MTLNEYRKLILFFELTKLFVCKKKLFFFFFFIKDINFYKLFSIKVAIRIKFLEEMVLN